MAETKCDVLLVEDDVALQELVTRMVSRRATSIDTASDGEDAIAKLRARAYDVVVLDLMLPKKNGLLVAEAIAAMPQRPHLIVLSAISRHFAEHFPPGTVLLQKPFDIEKIADAFPASFAPQPAQ